MAPDAMKGTQLAEAGAPRKSISLPAIYSEKYHTVRDLQASHLAREHSLSRAMARILAEHVYGEGR